MRQSEFREGFILKKIGITVIKSAGFFLGWVIIASILPLSSSEEPAVWRLWAEIMPLLAILVFTFIFWFVEKKQVKLHLLDHPVKGILLGTVTGLVWLAVPVWIMYMAKCIHFGGMNSIKWFSVWMLAAFLNVIMQELLVRGYLYQMLRQKHNIAAAAVATTGIFTALHGGAFEAGIIPVFNVLTMSLFMTAVLEYSGSIIAPIVMHFLWNGICALILGGVSLADDYPSLLITTFTGNELLSGGVCGIEGSVIVFIVNLVLAALFIFLNIRKKSEPK